MFAEKIHKNYLGLLFSYIQSSVIDNSRPKCLASVHRRYCHFGVMVDTDVNVVPMVDKSVREKILGHYGEKVKMDIGRKKHDLVLYSIVICVQMTP